MSLSNLLRRAVLTAALAAGFAGAAQAQTVLVVDREQVLSGSAVGQYIATQLQPIQQSIQNELQGQAGPLQQEEQAIQAEASALTPEALQQRPDLMQRAQTLGQQAQQFATLQQQRAAELSATRDQALVPVATAISEIENAIMLERGALVVLDANLPYQFSTSVDISQEVINRLNQRMTTTPVTRVTLPVQGQAAE